MLTSSSVSLQGHNRRGEDRDVGDEEDNNNEQVIAALNDLDIVTAARFGVL